MHERIIFHVDMDAFFASVEIANNPSLEGKAVIIGGDPKERGVVSTCSYQARTFGVHSAMPTWKAKHLCPNGVFLKVNMPLYIRYSKHIMNIMRQMTEIVEVVSIDEAYLDFSDTSFASNPEAAAIALHEKIYTDTKLLCSIGIASNKLISKISSSYAKPNGLYRVPCGKEEEFLDILPIKVLPGVGPKTKKKLNSLKINTIHELKQLSLETLVHYCGSWGYNLFQFVRGIDKRPVVSDRGDAKSISAETTFKTDLKDRDDIVKALKGLVDKTCKRLNVKKLKAKGIFIKIRYNDFNTITRSKKLLNHTDEMACIESASIELFNSSIRLHKPIRLIGFGIEIVCGKYWQPTLWEFADKQ